MKSGRFLKAGHPSGKACRSEMARTQQQRREETIARLLDASIDTIIEVGYVAPRRSRHHQARQVSDGALFRHFPTMGDFMAATAYEVMRRQLEDIRQTDRRDPARQAGTRRPC